MKESIVPFIGFSPELFKYLKDLGKNNNTIWFNNHKNRYYEFVVKPAKAFINDIGDFFNRLDPAIRTEPKFNSTILRFNKDMRFAKGEPYRNYLLVHFGRFKMDTEFFLYFEEDSMHLGLFVNNSDEPEHHFKKNLKKYEKDILNVFGNGSLNNKYDLYEMNKEPVLNQRKFNAVKHLSKLNSMKYFILEKIYSQDKKIIYSDKLLIEAIKIYSQLFPLYCFAVSSNPLTKLKNFEENFGILT